MTRVLDMLSAEAALAAWQRQSPRLPESEWQNYACKLVTPLYGGGVRAGEVDQDLPIRAAALRGQLRFWWRVACSADEPPTKLFEREVAIWGGITETGPRASQVRVRVRKVGPLQLEAAFHYESNPQRPGELKTVPRVAAWAEGYALFSAQGKLTRNHRNVEEEPKVLGKPGIEFELALACSSRITADQRQEVLTALRWWASFGGVGARTRRGLGAVQVGGLEPVTAEDVKRRGGILALRAASSGATDAWKSAVGLLKSFRQKQGVGRNTPSADSRSPAGRSLWPEADSIRALSGRSEPRHKIRLVAVDGFPRAAFGLPIVFHFKDENAGDPNDHVLEPADLSPNEKRDRLASPLILRPYWLGTRWFPAALLLPGWEKHLGLALKFKGRGYVPASWPANPATAAVLSGTVHPLTGRGDNALSAFMQFFQEP